MASGDYLGVLDHDDELDPLTLFEYVKTINEHPDADCIYCDEDKIDQKMGIPILLLGLIAQQLSCHETFCRVVESLTRRGLNYVGALVNAV